MLLYYFPSLIVALTVPLVVNSALPEGYDITRAKGIELLTKCPFLSPESYTPSCEGASFKLDKPPPGQCDLTLVTLRFDMNTFYGVNDVAETFSLNAASKFSWRTPCTTYNPPNMASIYLDSELFWKPGITHKNAVDNLDMSYGFGSRFYIKPRNDSVDFYLQRFGVFTGTCRMDFRKFPFDEQTCSIEFLMYEEIRAMRFEDSLRFTALPTDFGEEWSLVGTSSRVERAYVEGNRSMAVLTLHIRRHPHYYVNTLLIPCCLLSGMELVAFFMPPAMPDRPVFAAALMISLAFTQGQIQNQVPVKPYRIFMSTYADLCMALAWLCSVYSLASCGLVRDQREWFSEMTSKRFHLISRARFMDLLAFLASLTFFVLIQVYAIIVMVSTKFFD